MNTSAHERAIRATATAFGVPERQLASRCRYQSVCEARFVLFTLLADDSSFRIADIARMLGRDHGTILHGLRRAVELAAMDKRYAAKMAKAAELYRFAQ